MEHVLPLLVNTVLNGLDAVAYGPLLTGHANGIGLYLISTATAQLLLPMLSSFPFGVTACTMVESIPFMNSIRMQANGNVSTMLAGFIILTILTALGFSLLRVLDLERAIHQFPRVVLLGMMAGVGIFLLGAARNMGNRNGTIFMIGFVSSLFVVFVERRYKLPFVLPCATILIVFSFYTWCLVSSADFVDLRENGWLPQSVQLDPIYYYSRISVGDIDLRVIMKILPTAIAGAALNLLHVPINVPSLSRFSGMPFRMDQELLAHALINLASSFLGFAPTYMAYTNSILFLKSGSRTRLVGLLLSLTTMALLFVFECVIVWIPSLVAVFLICNLAIDLIVEAVFVPLNVARRREWSSIVLIMTISGYFGFIAGLLSGLFLSVLILYFDKRAKSRSESRAAPVIVIGAIRDQVTEHFAKRFINITKLDSRLTFEKSMKILDTIQSYSPDIRFHIIDYSDVAALDLNVLEEFLCIFTTKQEHPPIEFVFVNCEIDSLIKSRTIRNFPTLRHAEKYSEMRLMALLGEQEKQELDAQMETFKYIERQLLWTCEKEFFEKEAGEHISLEEPFFLFIEAGQATVSADNICFVESGAWIFPGCTVLFSVTTTGYIVDTSSANIEHVNQIIRLYTI